MAVMGMRLAQRVNGVSLLHGQVSREMFAGLWPGFDTREVPIGSVTNGVHTPTWVAPEVFTLLSRGDDPSQTPPALFSGGTHPPGPPLGETPSPQTPLAPLGDWERAATAPAAEIWAARRVLRARLVAETRRRLRASWRQRGASEAELTWIDDVLDEHVLTIGFARRVPSYKRLTLMLNNPEQLSQLLNDPDQPLQIVVAGKAHPADDGGKALIQQMVQFSDSRGRAAQDRVPARLRHGHGGHPGPGLRRVAEQPAAPAGGVRHLRHEGGAERRPEPVGARRLVGRVVRRRERLGDPVRRRRGRRRPPRRARGPGPVRDARQVGGAAVLRPRRGRHPGSAGWTGSGTRSARSGPRCRPNAWSGST